MLLLAGLLAGCDGKYKLYSVEGTVTLPDGTPLEGVHVSFDCQELGISATGMTDSDGRYRLGTIDAGDGAPTGDYRVAVVERDVIDIDEAPPPRISGKYGRFESSGLTFSVKEESNTFDIVLDSP
jgi:hypothetical protein